LATLSLTFSRYENREDQLIELLAFVGRYGNQPYSVAQKLPITVLHKLSQALTRFLEKEKGSSMLEGG
jgi:hypothetical protein